MVVVAGVGEEVVVGAGTAAEGVVKEGEGAVRVVVGVVVAGGWVPPAAPAGLLPALPAV